MRDQPAASWFLRCCHSTSLPPAARLRAEFDDAALGAPAHGAAHMRLRGRPAAAGQDELRQPRQGRVVVRQPRVQARHLHVLQHRVAGNAQLAAEVEQVVLDVHEVPLHFVGQGLGQQQAEVRVELVDVAHRLHPQRVLARARAVAQAGAAVVAGARADLRKAIAHGLLEPCPTLTTIRKRTGPLSDSRKGPL